MMKLKVFKKGFNFSQDGPGNRLVVHLQGCNMRCPWCSNPEGMEARGALIVNRDMVLDTACPFGAIRDGKRDGAICDRCGTRECVAPERRNAGIRLSCEEMDIEELAALAADCRAFFFGGGGVTLSGGEPTLQFEAVKELLERLKKTGIDTAMETNATSNRLEELLPLIDHLMMDYKVPDAQRHEGITGVPDGRIRENIRAAGLKHRDVIVRTPLIGGVNDSAGDREAFLDFYGTCRTECIAFEFLPYFDYGRVKWEQCGMKYGMGEGAHIGADTLRAYTERFREKGYRVVRT